MKYGSVVVFGNSIDSFARMARAVSASIAFLPRPVFIQAGADLRYFRDHPDCVLADWVVHETLEQNIASCGVVICHGGVGIIKEALLAGFRPAVFVRNASLGEHIDDHQAEWMEVLRQKDLAVQVSDADDLRSFIGAARFRNDARQSLDWLDDGALRSDLDCYIRSVISK